MEQNNDLSNQFQNLNSHFEKGKREDSIANRKEQFRENNGELEQIQTENSKYIYKVLTHICNDIIRIFEIDSPIKCGYCGEEVK